jgi:cobalt-zinc-cadmium efflux system outer membrane protein
MVKAAEAKLSMARREYVPDITLNGTYFSRNSREFPDMWSATATFNIPLYFRTKQDEGVREGLQSLSQAKHELRATQLMISSALRDSYSMIKTAEQLMDLYQKALIPKNYQDYELALSGYVSGKIEAITVISTLKALLDSELLYWVQVTEREKAIARHESLIGAVKNGS